MRLPSLRATLATLLLGAAPALAQSAPQTAGDDLAARFGAREAFDGVALSPDGTRISYLTPMGKGGGALVITNLADNATRIALSNPDATFKLSGCGWAKVDRLICSVRSETNVTGQLLGARRLLSVDPAGGKTILLGETGGGRGYGFVQDSGGILDYLPDDPVNILMQVDGQAQISTGTRVGIGEAGLAVVKVNVRTGSTSVVQTPRPGTDFWGADGSGALRIRGTIKSDNLQGYMGRKMETFYLPKGSKDYLSLGVRDLTANSGIQFAGFDETGDWMMVLKPLDGRQALYRIAADGSKREELLISHPRVDIAGVKRVGKYDRPVGAVYTTEYTHIAYFDQVLKKRLDAIGRALPGKPLVWALDESWDGTKQLLFAGSDVDPGRYYLFDTGTRQLTELSPARPQLEGLKLATMTPVTYPAADGTMIPAYLTLPPGRTEADAKNLPAILMPHGGPQARDTWGFDWLSQYFAQLGYAVLQPNFRGSAGYGEAWFAENGFKSWKTAIGDVNDGARWLAGKGIADPRRLAIFGWSYGGYAALQGAVADPGLYKAVVAVAPVTDLALLVRQRLNFSDYLIVKDFVGDGPHITEGSPAKNAGKIAAPVLMFHGTKDLNVDIGQAQAMDEALKAAGRPGQLIVYEGLEHSLVDSTTRADMLRRSAAFLAANVK